MNGPDFHEDPFFQAVERTLGQDNLDAMSPLDCSGTGERSYLSPAVREELALEIALRALDLVQAARKAEADRAIATIAVSESLIEAEARAIRHRANLDK